MPNPGGQLHDSDNGVPHSLGARSGDWDCHLHDHRSGAPVGFVDCIENFNHNNPVSQCSKQWGTVTVNSSGALKVTFTSVSLTGQTLTLPTDDTNTGNAFWLGTQADPALFYDDSQ